jgi:ATP-dependent phosphoenolpyruvate carboxykinase
MLNSLIRSPRICLRSLRQRSANFATASELGIDKYGISYGGVVHHNLSYDDIAEHEGANAEGVFASNGTFVCETGKFTGRSPKDKYVVEQEPSKHNLWWGAINQPVKEEVFDVLYEKVTSHYSSNAEKMYVFDGYCGANPASRKKVRFITELAWQHHFVTNMFLRPETREELENFEPDFTIINGCKVDASDVYKDHDLNSEVFIAMNVEREVAVIGGTWYGGEMKKGIFSMMNYWLPLEGIMSMHCSANVGKDGDSALFFGLSGTGKTTLSADPNRFLIGDDEHGWDDDGIFNFEGGCYAKTIDLSPENEPEIYAAIKRDALLENVWLEGPDNTPDYYNTSKTQNGRVSYPIHHIDNFKPDSMAGHPDNIIFLTCDAYGVLPPVSKLSSGQAMYHFLSGYTAKVAGTERGVTEPEATFSACFGAAFLPLHPTKYADLLQQKLAKHGTNVYLVNTGWTGGAYGVGSRMSIQDTRACIDGILDGSIKNCEFVSHPVFGFDVPKTLGAIEPNVLNPRDSWDDKPAYDAAAAKLAGMFKANFEKYTGPDVTDYSSYGPN